MRVQQILKMKKDDGVVTIAPTATVNEALEMLSARGIGAVVVSADGKRANGILSERDVVRALSRNGPDCLTKSVETIMTAKLVTATCDEDSLDVFRKMTQGRFRHLPVVEGDEMVGLISIGDVVAARLSELAMEKDALEGMIMGH